MPYVAYEVHTKRYKMLKIAICDDVKSYMDILEKNILAWATQSGINVKVRKFDSGKPLLHCIDDNGMFDLIFLDIRMKRMNGLEVASRIREHDYITAIIFISQYDDYYKEAYDVHPFHFLSKPIGQSAINHVMDSFMRMKMQDKETYSFSINKARYTLHLSDILYFGSERRQIYIVCQNTKYMFYGKLDDVQKQLEEKTARFIRIHQSYLVNMKYVREYHYADVIMSNGDVLLISRDRRKNVRSIHMLLMK